MITAVGLTILLAAPADALEVKLCVLAEAHAAGWPEIPRDTPLDPTALSRRRRVFIEGSRAIPVKALEVERARAEALRGLSAGDRARLVPVLDALGDWAAEHLAEDAGPTGNPSAWRTADAVLRDRKGNPFEQVRALAALLRSAGIPARPTFNGLPLLCVYAAPRGRPGFWTTWDPLHPSGSAARLPVLWLPLRAGEASPLETLPVAAPCRIAIEGHRYVARDAAAAAFAALKADGRFPAAAPPPLPADAGTWWETWSIGASLDPDDGSARSVRFVLPFAKDGGLAAREHAVWISDPRRLRHVSVPHTETDQELGGLLIRVEAELVAPPPAASASLHGA